MALLSSARARYLLGSQIAIIITSAEAEMISEELDESGYWRKTRVTIAAASVLRQSARRSDPIAIVARLSKLGVPLEHQDELIDKANAQQKMIFQDCLLLLTRFCPFFEPPNHDG